MTAFDSLLAAAGTWNGTSTLQDPNSGRADDSSSTASVTPLLGGRFVRVDYTWSYDGKPQEGSILIGQEPAAGVSSAYWIDSWHNGRKGMLCAGALPDETAISLRGAYAAPPGPDWGWRLTITPPHAASTELRVTMFNIWPESEGGREDLAVDARYTRA